MMRRRCGQTGSRAAPLLVLAAAVVALAACNRGREPSDAALPTETQGLAPWFEEVGAARGLHFTHRSGHQDRYLMPEIMSGGAAMLDMDADGDLDVYLVQSGSLDRTAGGHAVNRLYRNRGDGSFEDVTEGSGAGDGGYGMGVACGDYDNDGDTDLYVTNVGPNVLLRNDGTGGFIDVSDQAGVGDAGFGSSAAFVDYDHDGDLDLLALNYLNWSVATELSCYNGLGEPDYCDPQNYNAPARDTLYRNDGDGTFSDVTEQAGLSGAVGTGLGVVCGDFNGDGRVDLFVANDGMPDHLWVNQGDGTFRNDAMPAGCAIDRDGVAKAGMGVTAADVDDDGDLDLMICNLAGESDSVFRNEGGFFTDVTATAGLGAVSRPFTRFGMGWIDFDNDGVLDLYQANGRVMRQATRYSADPFAEPNLLFRGRPGWIFQEVESRGGTAPTLIATSHAAAFGDLDNDGGVDVIVINRDGPAHLLSNIAPDRGNWISLRVLDAHGRDALGATVGMIVGDRTITRDVRSASSYCAANDPRVHVGLGPADHVTDLTVRWPDGTIERFPPLGAQRINGTVTLRQGTGS